MSTYKPNNQMGVRLTLAVTFVKDDVKQTKRVTAIGKDEKEAELNCILKAIKDFNPHCKFPMLTGKVLSTPCFLSL